ncbi:MAG TPA: helix-turn-helix transcriptional regulator [Thermomicrobiales bacterium]|nr:helix-turn-helix transcriptional regulator [Thermomicrobiales bacterium]
MDDQVIHQTDINRQDTVALVTPIAPASREPGEFPRMLERLRDERGWSKADLAKRAQLDPSSITRFEQGSRHPDRDTVLMLADTMALPLTQRDRLLAAAGYRSELWDDPLLVDLSSLLADADTPSAIREEVRSILKAALAYGRLGRMESQ